MVASLRLAPAILVCAAAQVRVGVVPCPAVSRPMISRAIAARHASVYGRRQRTTGGAVIVRRTRRPLTLSAHATSPPVCRPRLSLSHCAVRDRLHEARGQLRRHWRNFRWWSEWSCGRFPADEQNTADAPAHASALTALTDNHVVAPSAGDEPPAVLVPGAAAIGGAVTMSAAALRCTKRRLRTPRRAAI